MLSNIRTIVFNQKTVIGVYILFAITASVQALLLKTHLYGDRVYTEFNNYIIFKHSFFHLIAARNLYIPYPNEYWDLYKYSPTFAFCMGLFAYLPNYIGLSAWNILNAVALFGAIRMLPLNEKTKTLLLWFVLPELFTCLQNCQSNGLMAALLIAAFCFLEKNKTWLAALLIVVSVFIKVYGAIGFCMFILYPNKRKFIMFAVVWTVAILLIPLLVNPLHTLEWQYINWISMIMNDQSTSYGLSVMGWLSTWFGINDNKNIIMLAGAILFCIPFLKTEMYNDRSFRLLILSSLLIWVIIFNHKAESPTYIIAVTGVGIWYLLSSRNIWQKILLGIAFVFTSLSPTDIFPTIVRVSIFMPYNIKAVPCILVWIALLFELVRMKNNRIVTPSAISQEHSVL